MDLRSEFGNWIFLIHRFSEGKKFNSIFLKKKFHDIKLKITIYSIFALKDQQKGRDTMDDSLLREYPKSPKIIALFYVWN